jgi:uncharacterized glyoxalase superfamily protein PhnB
MLKTATTKSPIMPCLTYRDAPAAIAFLCEAFGFEKKMVVPGENDTIAHAELVCGNAMIMVGSVKDKNTPYGKLVMSPQEAGGSTQSIYLVVDDADVHHAQAKAGGAKMIIPLETKDYGGRDYTCQDCEGYVWTFGTYDPWSG